MTARPGLIAAVALAGCALTAGAAPRAPLFPAPVVDVSSSIGPSAVGDLDGDGRPDLVILGELPGGASIALSDPAGGFRPEIVFEPTHPFAQDVAIADLDGDGHADIVYGSGRVGDNLFVQRGRGDGTFHPATGYAIATGASSIAVADLDRDGRLDLVVADDDVRWLRNAGAGEFAEPLAPAPGFGGGQVAVGDFDGDGADDLASAATVVLGQGDGTFGAIHAVGFAEPFVVGDFDGDGADDLAAADGATVQLLLSVGGGGFVAGPSLASGAAPRYLTVADFDRDGRDDLAVGHQVAGARFITVFEAIVDPLPAGPRQTAVPTGGGELGLHVADFNLDGRPDLAAPIYNTWAGMILRNAAGSFDVATRHPVGSYPRSVAAADFDGDGSADLVVANRDSRDISVLLGTGDGGFLVATAVAAGLAPHSIAVADLQADGNPDLVVTDEDSDSVSILLGNGAGAFTPAGTAAVGTRPAGVAAGFLNGDAVVDLVVASRGDDAVSVLLGVGDGSFAPAATVPAGAGPDDVVIADLDGLGGADLIVANYDAASISVLLGDGVGGFAAPVPYGVGPLPTGVAVTDLDGDGHLDVVVLNGGYSLSTLRGNGDGTFRAEWRHPEFFRVPGGMRVADVDGDGLQDVVVAHFPWHLRFLRGLGDGTLGPSRGFAGPYTPTGLALDDFDRDGRPDVAAISAAEPDRAALALNGLGVPQLRFDDVATLRWPVFWGADGYRLYRGELAAFLNSDNGDGVPAAGYGDCAGAIDSTSFDDEQPDPPPGTGRFYLLEAVGLGGPAGGLGRTSGGLPREPTTTCPD